jgi:general secretion pathway protein K
MRCKRIATGSGNDGMALIITLMIVALLTAAVVEMNRNIRETVASAALFRDRVTLSHMVQSGFSIGEAVLIDDRNNTETDSLQEQWADPTTLEEIAGEFPFEEGRVRLQITDLRSRLQVNALVNFPGGREFNENQRMLWLRFFELISISQAQDSNVEPIPIVNAVKDWLDSGDDDATTGLDGAESDYYLDKTPPYACRNGPVIDISELALVKGIPPEVFSTPHAGYSLVDCVTVFGRTEAAGSNGFTFDGRININTAPFFVLSALLPLEDAHLGAELAEYRTEMSDKKYVHDLSRPDWYKNVPGCEEVTLNSNLVTNRSDFFEIAVTAFLHDLRMTRTAAVRRLKDPKSGKIVCEVLSYSE